MPQHARFGFVLVALAAALVSAVPLAQTPQDAGAFFDSGGVQIHYEVIGEGKPIVLIHGFGASFRKALVPPPLLAALADRQLIGLDVRGFGLSGKPDDPAAYGLEVTRDIVRLLDHLKIARADLLGISMGSLIALKTAALNPDRVSSIILGAQGWASKEELEEMAAPGVEIAATSTDKLPDDLRIPVQQMGRHIFTGFVQAYPALYVTPEEIDRLKMPIIAVLGSEDPRVARAEALRARRPATEIVIVPGKGHAAAMADERFAAAVSAFLKK